MYYFPAGPVVQQHGHLSYSKPTLWSLRSGIWRREHLFQEIDPIDMVAAWDHKKGRFIVLSALAKRGLMYEDGKWRNIDSSVLSPGDYRIVYNSLLETFELFNFQGGKKWVFRDDKWVSDERAAIPRLYTYNHIYDASRGRVICLESQGILEIRSTGWNILKELTQHELSQVIDLVYDDDRNTSLLFRNISTNSEHRIGIFEISDQILLEIESFNAPVARFHSAFGYDYNSATIIMYGGTESRDLSAGVVLQDLWSLKYDEQGEQYVWTRLDEEGVCLVKSDESGVDEP